MQFVPQQGSPKKQGMKSHASFEDQTEKTEEYWEDRWVEEAQINRERERVKKFEGEVLCEER